MNATIKKIKSSFRASTTAAIFFVAVIGSLLTVICMMFFCMNCEKMCNRLYKKGHASGSIYKVYVYHRLPYNVCHEDFFLKLKVLWFHHYPSTREFTEKYSFKDNCIMDGSSDHLISSSYQICIIIKNLIYSG